VKTARLRFVALGFLGCCCLAACNSPTPAPSDSVSATAPSSMPAPAPMPAPTSEGGGVTDLTTPPIAGMVWPAAVSRAAAAGFSVVPNFAGPPGPLTADCVVVQQSPVPGEPARVPVINALVQCPSTPVPPSGLPSGRSDLPTP
jgi:hypothetical protein